jgi:hypothetical protein
VQVFLDKIARHCIAPPNNAYKTWNANRVIKKFMDMNLTTETLAIFTLLVPGFITSAILNLLTVRKDRDALARIIEALVFSFLIYAVASYFLHQNPTTLIETKNDNEKEYTVTYNPEYTATVTVVAIVMACIFGWAFNSGCIMELARKLRLTTKTGRMSLWADVFATQRRYVIVNLSDGRRIFGWPMFTSDTSEEGTLYLYDPAWVDDGKYIELDIHGLFLVKKDYIESIEFTKVTDKNAKPRE